MQSEVNAFFLLLFVSDDGDDYVRLSFVFDMRLRGQMFPKVFVEHVRCICPISTETETAWNFSKKKKTSSVTDFVKRMGVALPIGPNYLTTFHRRMNTKPGWETLPLNFVSFNGRWTNLRKLIGLKFHEEPLNDYRVITCIRTDGQK
jgi:hypothetical protein